MRYHKTRLSSGQTVISANLAGRQSLAVGIWLRAGGRFEQKKNSGISHFLEHLVFKGTRQRSADSIKQAIEGVGGTLNAFTSEEFTCYLTRVVAKHLNLALDVLADLVLNPLLRREDIEKEKGVVIEEIRMYRDQPAHYVQELLNSLLWPAEPLGRALTGTPETIRSLGRQDLIDYRKKFYTSDNVVVTASGNLDHEQLLKMAERYLRGLPSGKKNRFRKTGNRQKNPQLGVQAKETEQTHLALGLHGLSSSHPDRHVLNLLSIILGGNMSSRLFDEIREKRGWAYAISSQPVNYQDTGALIISAGVDNRRKLKVVSLILKELARFCQEPVSRGELGRAKEFYSGQLQLSLEDVANQMFWMGERELSLGYVPTSNEILGEIAKIEAKDIQRLAQVIFEEKSLNLALVGPVSGKERNEIEKRLVLR